MNYVYIASGPSLFIVSTASTIELYLCYDLHEIHAGCQILPLIHWSHTLFLEILTFYLGTNVKSLDKRLLAVKLSSHPIFTNVCKGYKVIIHLGQNSPAYLILRSSLTHSLK